MSALLRRALEKVAQGKDRLAIADCTRAFDADPDCAKDLGPALETREAYPIRAWLGKLAAMAGRGEEGLAHLDFAVAAAPKQAYLYAWRGETRRRLGDAAGAREDFERALTLDPREAVARVGRARLRLAAGDAKGALEDADRAARDLRGYEEAPLEGARACLALGDGRGVLRRLETAFRRANRYGWKSLGAAGDAGLSRLASDESCAPRPWRARRLAWTGEAFLSEGDAEDALKALTEALRLEPGLSWARGFRGEALIALGRKKEGEAELSKALSRDRALARAAIARGRLRLQAGRAKEAEADFTLALASDRTWIAALAWRARARAALRDRAGAASDAAAARRLSPRAADLPRLAAELLVAGDFDAAACALGGAPIGWEAALRNVPSQQLMYSYRPWGGGEAPAWLAAARKGGPALRTMAGAALACAGRAAEALPLLDEAVSAAPALGAARLARGAARLFDARTRRDNSALPACLADLDAALAADPKDGRALRLRAEIRADREDAPGARADLLEALRLDPSDEWSRVELVDLLGDMGLHREALRHAAALKPRPREGWYWAVLGRARALAGDRRAVADLERAARLSPRSASILGWRGEARRKTRRYAAALADFDRAIELDPGFVYAHEWRARLLLMLGRPADALKSADALCAGDPRHVYGPAYRSEALFKLGRFEEACRELDKIAPMHPRSFWSPRVSEGKAPGSPEAALRADLAAAQAAHPGDPWVRAFSERTP